MQAKPKLLSTATDNLELARYTIEGKNLRGRDMGGASLNSRFDRAGRVQGRAGETKKGIVLCD
jgi:hypothetical protein